MVNQPEILLMDEESTGRMVIPPEITSSWTRNLLEEGYSAGNHQLIDEDSAQGMEFRWESLAHAR
jgi:hypothetical protein